MHILDLIALLVFTYGAFVYSAMLVVWTRGPRRGPWQAADSVGVAIGVLSAVWFVFHAVATVWPDGEWSRAGRLGTVSLSIAMTFAYPPLIMHVTWVQLDPVRRRALPAAVRGGLPAMYVAVAAVAMTTIADVWGVIEMPGLTRGPIDVIVAGAFITCGVWSAFVTTRAGRQHESPMEARSQRVITRLFLAMAVAFVLMLLAWQTLLVSRAIEILVTSLPLVFLFAGTWLEDRLTFYDIFLKRGLTLFVTLFACTGWFALVLPALDGFGVSWWRPWAFALASLPLAIAAPALVRRGEAWLDRAWFGRQVSTLDAIARVLDTANHARDDGDLRGRLQDAFSDILGVPVRIDEVTAASAPPVGRVPCSPDGVSVVVDGGEGPAWRVTVDADEASRSLLSEDVARIQTLARVAGPLVRAMRVQQMLRAHEVQARQLVVDARRAELRALRAQIDPHFLFNALNAVAGLVHVDANRADRAVEALADVFRYTLRASEREWARVDDELAFAEAYLAVEHSRFGDERLAVSVVCDPDVAATPVPALVIQTLVENAIKHGVARTRERARVDVRARADGEVLVVTVENDGPAPGHDVPAGADAGEREGVGLRNIRARLAGYYGDGASLVLERDGRTRAILRVPRAPGVTLVSTPP